MQFIALQEVPIPKARIIEVLLHRFLRKVQDTIV